MFHCLHPSIWKKCWQHMRPENNKEALLLLSSWARACQWQLSRRSRPPLSLSNPGAVKVHRFDARISSVGKKCSKNNKQRWRATLHPDDQSYCHVYMFICMADSSAGKQELQFAWTYQHFNYCPALKLAELLGNFQPSSSAGWDWGKLKWALGYRRGTRSRGQERARPKEERERSLLVN